MIEDYIKDKVIAITSFCDTDEKRQVLINNIILLRQNFPIQKLHFTPIIRYQKAFKNPLIIIFIKI